MDNIRYLPWGLPRRIQHISELLKTNPGENYPLKFQEPRSPIISYRVPIELPVYRLSNGRTTAQQEEYIVKMKRRRISSRRFQTPLTHLLSRIIFYEKW